MEIWASCYTKPKNDTSNTNLGCPDMTYADLLNMKAGQF